MPYYNHANAAVLQGVYPICDLPKFDLDALIPVLNQSDVSLCQLRMKQASHQVVYDTANYFRQHLKQTIKLIINDHLDIALQVADGVHLGQSDLADFSIEKQYPDDFIIGVSCHSIIEAQIAEILGASYISVGAIHPSKTKTDTIPTDLATLKMIIDNTTLPVGAIGGLTAADFEPLRALGVSLFAMTPCPHRATGFLGNI